MFLKAFLLLLYSWIMKVANISECFADLEATKRSYG